MNSRPASIRRRLDLLTDNELATISATIAAQEVAMQQRQVQMMNEALSGDQVYFDISKFKKFREIKLILKLVSPTGFTKEISRNFL